MALSLFAVNEGYLDDVPANKVVAFESALHSHAESKFQSLMDRINESGDYNDEIAAELHKAVKDFKETGAY
jgi:F-type H+/Na+-transporting ATPase subunit alpha